jgi:hypothetical protein
LSSDGVLNRRVLSRFLVAQWLHNASQTGAF